MTSLLQNYGKNIDFGMSSLLTVVTSYALPIELVNFELGKPRCGQNVFINFQRLVIKPACDCPHVFLIYMEINRPI